MKNEMDESKKKKKLIHNLNIKMLKIMHIYYFQKQSLLQREFVKRDLK